MNLLRNGMVLRRPGRSNIAESVVGANKTILPIPIRETDLNPNISQNRGLIIKKGGSTFLKVTLYN